MQEITIPEKDEWLQWKNSNTGRFFFETFIKGMFQQHAEGVISGQSLDTDSVDTTALETTRLITKTKTLYDIGNYSYEQVRELLGSPVETPNEDDDYDS